MCITSDHFTWMGKKGVSEESSLPEHLVSRVYNDAADYGFLVRSTRTRRVILFTVSERLYRETSHEREFLGTRFADAEGAGLTIDILND